LPSWWVYRILYRIGVRLIQRLPTTYLSYLDYYLRSLRSARRESADVYHAHDLSALPVKRPLEGLKVVSYYGCLISRPKGGFDDPEDPRSLDDLMAAIGAEPVAWAYKTKCCGGAVFIPRKQIALELTGKILVKAHQAGADVIAVACPFCHLLLDMYQDKALKQVGAGFRLPILYFSQLMGVALGIEDERLELRGNVVSPFVALERIAS